MSVQEHPPLSLDHPATSRVGLDPWNVPATGTAPDRSGAPPRVVRQRTIVRRPQEDRARRPAALRLALGVAGRLRWVRRLVSLAAILLLWHLASRSGWLPPEKFPAPTAVWDAFTELLRDGSLGTNLLASVGRIGRGLALGAGLAVIVGTVAGLSRIGEEVVDAPLQALRVIPSLALMPLFIIWFGIAETSKIGLIALGSFFPVYLNLFSGIRNVDSRLVEASRVFGLNRLGLAWRVMIPGALPQLLVGLRQSIGVAWLSLVVVEQTNARAGIGALIIDAREFSRTDIVVVGLLIYAVLGLLTDLAVRLIERGALSWRVSFTGT